jgi:hypothetical protein
MRSTFCKKMMKLIGLLFLLAGFVWLLIEVESFTSYQHSLSIWQTQNLPPGDSIQRSDAASGMRELSLELNKRHRFTLIPGCLMLAGGLLIFFSLPKTRRLKPAEQAAPSNGG